LWSLMPRGKRRAVCIALAVVLWAAWLTTVGASFALSLYAMWLTGLSLPVAALAAGVGASVGVGVYVYLARERVKWLFAAVRELGPDNCRLDEEFTARLGVEVYMCTALNHYGTALNLPKRRIVVNHLSLSKEEVEAVVYHEFSHVRRIDGVLEYAAEGAAKASAVVVVFQLALAAGLGPWAYFAAAAAAVFVLVGVRGLLAEGYGAAALLLMAMAAALPLFAHLPPGPAPQIDPSAALAAVLAAAGAYLASHFDLFAAELLSDVETALAVGPGPMLNLLVKTWEKEREAIEWLKREFKARGWKFPTLWHKLYNVLSDYPPTPVSIRLLKLCAK